MGLIPGHGGKIPHALWPKILNIKKKKKKEAILYKFNKDFKNGPYQKDKKINKNKKDTQSDLSSNLL